MYYVMETSFMGLCINPNRKGESLLQPMTLKVGGKGWCGKLMETDISLIKKYPGKKKEDPSFFFLFYFINSFDRKKRLKKLPTKKEKEEEEDGGQVALAFN